MADENRQGIYPVGQSKYWSRKRGYFLGNKTANWNTQPSSIPSFPLYHSLSSVWVFLEFRWGLRRENKIQNSEMRTAVGNVSGKTRIHPLSTQPKKPRRDSTLRSIGSMSQSPTKGKRNDAAWARTLRHPHSLLSSLTFCIQPITSLTESDSQQSAKPTCFSQSRGVELLLPFTFA